MNRGDRRIYSELFFSTFKLSACTFGGGFVIIPLMRKKFVEELGWIDEQEMLNLTAIAQSSPGPIAVNASILIGYHMAGVPGALLTALGTILPPLVIITFVSMFYQAFRNSAIANMALAGMLCGVAAVVLDVVVDMVLALLRQKKPMPLMIMIASFIAIRFCSVNIMIVILVCALIGAADSLRAGRRKGEGGK